jgi:hypothetical protein
MVRERPISRGGLASIHEEREVETKVAGGNARGRVRLFLGSGLVPDLSGIFCFRESLCSYGSTSSRIKRLKKGWNRSVPLRS